MNLLQTIINVLAPRSISCNETYDSDLPHDQVASDQDFSPVHNNVKRKVPGFEHILNPVLGVTGENQFIKGFKFDIAFPLSEYFQIMQSWEIPNSGAKQEVNPMMAMMPGGKSASKPTYTFMTQLVRDIRGQEPGIILMGKADNEGRVDSVFVKKLNENFNMKLSGNFHSSKIDDGALVADLEYEDKDTVSIARLSHSLQGLMFGFNYMQRVHSSLMLGFDYTNLITHKRSLFSYGGKAFIGNHSLYAAYMHAAQLHLGYVIPIRKGTTFVSHYKYDPESHSTAILGFKQRYAETEITATINSKAKLMTILNFKGPTYGLKLCAEVDYLRDNYSFGYGINIGPQQQ